MYLRLYHRSDLPQIASVQVALRPRRPPWPIYVVKEASMTKCATAYCMARLHFLHQVLLNPIDPGLSSRVERPRHPSNSDLQRPLQPTEPFAWRTGHRLGLSRPTMVAHSWPGTGNMLTRLSPR